MKTDLVVIGSGPAGLTAARTAAEAGARVLVLEESEWEGGRLALRVDTLADPSELQGQRADCVADGFAAAACEAGAVIETGTLAWGLFPGRVAILQEGRSSSVECRAVIVASGSLPTPYPFSGWTLPGVMTATAVERLINRHGFLPGQRAVVVGATAEADRVAWLLELCGAQVLRAEGIDSATGKGRVEQVKVGDATHSADLVVLAVGRIPQSELLSAAGCPLHGDGTPQHDTAQRTPLEGVLVAGSAAGAATLRESILTGDVAAISVVEQLGLVAEDEAEQRRSRLLAEMGERMRLSAPCGPLPTDEFALVCRCEEIPRTEIDDAIAAGAWTVDDVKRITRCGMGFCQGKSCSPTVVNLLRAAGAKPRGEILPLRLRPPVRPLLLGELAGDGLAASLLDHAIHPEGEEIHK